MAVAFAILLCGQPAPAETGPSGLELPRFASLRADEVNLRTGPGSRYPIDWVYVRRDVPVEIVAEYGPWRRVRDWQGTEGWIHRSLLSGNRTAMIRGGTQALRAEPEAAAAVVARAEENVIVQLLHCRADWCEIAIGPHHGWTRRAGLWGVLPGETIE